jgi:hypothetical protein
MPKRRRGSGLAVWGTGRADGPILVRCNEHTAEQLGITLDQLQGLVADLAPVTRHADGSWVWRIRDLLEALGQLPEPVETASHRGGRHMVRNREAAQGR